MTLLVPAFHQTLTAAGPGAGEAEPEAHNADVALPNSLRVHQLTKGGGHPAASESGQVRAFDHGYYRGASRVDCVPAAGDVSAEIFQFLFARDEFAPGEEERLKRFGASLPRGTRLLIHGYASVDGNARFNVDLSCHRANTAADLLRGLPSRPQIVAIFKHGPTPGAPALRRSVWVETIPSTTGMELTFAPGTAGRFDTGELKRGQEAWLTEQARLRGELPEYSIGLIDRYEYRRDTIIGQQAPGAMISGDQMAMMVLQSNPSRYFPFDVVGKNGEKGIVLEGEYDLVDRGGFFLPPGKFPIRVSAWSPTSFTFTTLEGHFDAPGSTVTFTTWTDLEGNIHLEQHGTAQPASPTSLTYGMAPLIPYLAGRAWDVQAANLRAVLEAPTHPGSPSGR